MVVGVWTKAALEAVLLGLDDQSRARLFGPEPRPQDFARPAFDRLEPLLRHVASRSEAEYTRGAIPEVRVDKLEVNALSHHVVRVLQWGRRGEPIVADFIAARPDPTFGESVATAFRAEYARHRDNGLPPDQIFHELTRFVGGDFLHEPPYQTAIYSVLAYFFERCDIFEDPAR